MTPDEEGLQQYLDHRPEDFTTRLVLADLYEETGRSGLAQVQRWLVKNRRYPYLSLNYGGIWFWWLGSYPGQEHAQLSEVIHDLLYKRYLSNKVQAVWDKKRQVIEDALFPILLQLGEIEE